MRVFLFVVACCLSWSAFAEDYSGVWVGRSNDGSYGTVSQWGRTGVSGFFGSPIEACQSFHSTYTASGVITYPDYKTKHDRCQNSQGALQTVWAVQGMICPGGGTLNTSGICVNAPACPTGQVRDSTTGQCGVPPPPPCQADEVVSSGYYDYGLQPADPMRAYGCSGGCEVVFEGDAPAARAIVGGVYHYFAQGSYVKTGTSLSCGAGSSPLASAPALPSTTCAAGQVIGQVNGQDRCVDPGTGTATNPQAPKTTTSTTTQNTVANPDGSSTTTQTTNMSDGSTIVKTTTTNADGSSSTTISGTGPSGSAATGVSDQGDDEGACPEGSTAAMCQEKVKIDEAGVPEARTNFQPENDLIDGAVNAVKTSLEAGDWKQLEFSFKWDPPIPAGGCSSVVVFGQSIDVCRPLSMARDLWGWVIYVLAGLAIWIRGSRALAGV